MFAVDLKNLVVVVLAATSVPCFAYSCSDSEAYKNGSVSLKEVSRSNVIQLGVAVKFVQKRDGVGFDEALKEVMKQDSSPESKAQDDQLAAVAAKIQAMKPQSEDECMALLQLQQQYGAIGQQKMALIVKGVTGQDTSSSK